METLLVYTGWTFFGIAIMAGLMLDCVGLFGNWIILGAAAIAWAATGFEHFGVMGLGIMAGLAVLGEVLEMAASGYGAAKFGGGKGTIGASIVGGIAGAVFGTPFIPIPIVGTLIGACIGAFLGAVLYEYIQMEKSAQEAAWTGFGAALGRVAGIFAKLFVGVAMVVVAYLTF